MKTFTPDYKNTTYKHWMLLIGTVLLSITLGLAVSPMYINYYLSHQPIDDVWTSSYNAREYGQFGKVVVFNTYISNVKNDSFTFIEKLPDRRDGRIVESKYATIINCKPVEKTQRKVAGSWNKEANQNNIGLYAKYNITFYTVWVIDGC